jgi:hypothetical protein
VRRDCVHVFTILPFFCLCLTLLCFSSVFVDPSLPFYDFMLPSLFGASLTDGRPKLARWRTMMLAESPAATENYREVWLALEKWWDSGRWDSIGMKPFAGHGKPVCPV